MKLVVLYGAPATGKYTVGKIIAERLGYKFFHNHLSIDVAKAILPFGAPGFFDLSDKIRLVVFEEAARHNIPGIVFTFVYKKGKGEVFIQSIIDVLAKVNADVQFIQLYCDKETLVERVENKQRKDMKKLTSPEELLKLLEEGEFQSTISNYPSERVDNSNLTIEETVEKVLASIE